MSTSKLLSKVLEKRLGPPSFGGFMRAARTMQDKSQTEMAEFLGISKSSLCDIEKRRHFVSAELAAKIARKCGLSEIVAVELALKDQLRRSGLNFEIELKKKSRSA